jgi:hypothetical protein
MARPSGSRTSSTGRNIQSAVRTSANHRVYNNSNWRHRHHRHHHHRHHRHHSRIYLSFGYPFGYGYPYYSSYPYRYGYYARPREVVYANTDGSTVAAVQRRLTRAGYYRGMVDGVIGPGTRSAIRSYERAHGLRVDGQIDRRLLATMGLA